MVQRFATQIAARLDWVVNHPTRLGYLLILPSVIGFLAFYAIPALQALVISFTEWNLLTDAEFVGFANYEDIFNDIRFWRALRTTVVYVLWNIPLQTIIAIIMALIMQHVHERVSGYIRTVLVLPWLLPSVVVALLWLWIMDPSLGVLNEILTRLGLARQPFLGSADTAIIWIAMINTWRFAGYTAILFFAGLKTIPRTLYEAAALDGAGAVAQFRWITLPLLRPVLVFVLVTSIIGSFQVFDTIAITTEGGPAGATRVLIFYIYDEVFNRRFSMGTATAASVVLCALLVTITLLQIRFLRGSQSDLADYS